MDKNNPLEIYEDDHTPDPVAVLAAKEAVAATDPEYRHPWLTRVVILIAMLLLLAGTFGAIVGAINTVQLSHAQSQSDQQRQLLETQQTCLIKLIKQQQHEQSVRNQIASDDRAVLDNLVDHAFTVKDPQKILDAYKRERAINDKRREKYGTKELSLATCSLSPIKSSTGVSPKPQAPSTKVKPSTSSSAAPKGAQSSSKAGGAHTAIRSRAVPAVASKHTTAVANTRTSSVPAARSVSPTPRPSTTAEASQTVTAPSPRTTPPLINLPPIKVCIPGLVC